MNANSLSETHAEATGNKSTERLKEFLHLFGHNIALYDYYTLLYYNMSSDDDGRLVGIIAQLARLDARIATKVTCLTEREKQGGYRQNIYVNA